MNNMCEKLYEYESKFSNLFFKRLGILENRIDMNDYIHIKDIASNKDLIEKIYKIISEIENSSDETRFLILGDFLFSITSYNLADPANLVYKITRNDYLNKIKIRASMNTLLSHNKYRYIEIHKKLLLALTVNKIIKKTIIRTLVDE
jgi:hypothetical protein